MPSNSFVRKGVQARLTRAYLRLKAAKSLLVEADRMLYQRAQFVAKGSSFAGMESLYATLTRTAADKHTVSVETADEHHLRERSLFWVEADSSPTLFNGKFTVARRSGSTNFSYRFTVPAGDVSASGTIYRLNVDNVFFNARSYFTAPEPRYDPSWLVDSVSGVMGSLMRLGYPTSDDAPLYSEGIQDFIDTASDPTLLNWCRGAELLPRLAEYRQRQDYDERPDRILLIGAMSVLARLYRLGMYRDRVEHISTMQDKLDNEETPEFDFKGLATTLTFDSGGDSFLFQTTVDGVPTPGSGVIDLLRDADVRLRENAKVVGSPLPNTIFAEPVPDEYNPRPTSD